MICQLKNIILSYPNIAKRQEFIKDFCIKNTRNAINDEEIYWLYCNKTNSKLVPSFLFKLANTFLNDNNNKDKRVGTYRNEAMRNAGISAMTTILSSTRLP